MKTKRNRHHGPSGKKYSNRGRSIYDRIAINALWLLHLGCTDGYICREPFSLTGSEDIGDYILNTR